MARTPIALSKPVPGETREEFAERFAKDVMAGIEAYKQTDAYKEAKKQADGE